MSAGQYHTAVVALCRRRFCVCLGGCYSELCQGEPVATVVTSDTRRTIRREMSVTTLWSVSRVGSIRMSRCDALIRSSERML